MTLKGSIIYLVVLAALLAYNTYLIITWDKELETAAFKKRQANTQVRTNNVDPGARYYAEKLLSESHGQSNKNKLK